VIKLYIILELLRLGENKYDLEGASCTFEKQGSEEGADMAMGWVDPWVGLGR